ncbi:hypothetical protein HS088_TW05G00241 [Tripterygium wilfordii]|uniref:Uncharacterized protein n=1 Tax=Tripterygium wilfordii TaxID=458696 RepID=A0A7J7DMK9_TRIWF|nr:hypothetical protein HS088_TW05G00241 [Tripterygium wilfordii]
MVKVTHFTARSDPASEGCFGQNFVGLGAPQSGEMNGGDSKLNGGRSGPDRPLLPCDCREFPSSILVATGDDLKRAWLSYACGVREKLLGSLAVQNSSRTTEFLRWPVRWRSWSCKSVLA